MYLINHFLWKSQIAVTMIKMQMDGLNVVVLLLQWNEGFISAMHMGFADRFFAPQDLEYLEPARALMQSRKMK